MGTAETPTALPCAHLRLSHHFQPSGPHAFLTRVDAGDPRTKIGVRYHPETDSFAIPSGKQAGPHIGPCEVPGRDFVRSYPNPEIVDLRRRRLDELRMTGRLEVRPKDRWGNKWPADQRLERHGGSLYLENRYSGVRHSDSRHGRSHRGHVPYEVEYPDIPEEEEAPRK